VSFNAFVIEKAQLPQVIPLIRMVVVLTAAETLGTLNVITIARTANKLIGLRIFFISTINI
jgi:hypothetical protein